MATSSIQAYAFDPTGRNPANLVQGEKQALTGAGTPNFYFLIPKFAPFFSDTLKVFYRSVSGEVYELHQGVDFYPSHWFLGASRACAKPIHASVTFLNTSLVGTITFQYQTLGGEWVRDTTVTAEVLADRIHNPRTTVWEQVVNQPTLFPPIDHEWNLVDMVGMSSVVDALFKLADVVTASGQSMSSNHINNTNNPHMVTCAQIGAVTQAQLITTVRNALTDAGAYNTDNLSEGSRNLFFTASRVLGSALGALPNVGNTAVIGTDTLAQAFAKLQVQINADRDSLQGFASNVNPVFSGVMAELIQTIDAATAVTSLDLQRAANWQVNVKASSSIIFNSTNIPFRDGNKTSRMVEWTVTTYNAVAGQGISWPTNVKWVDGVTPPRTTELNARDVYYFFTADDFNTVTGSLSNKNVL